MKEDKYYKEVVNLLESYKVNKAIVKSIDLSLEELEIKNNKDNEIKGKKGELQENRRIVQIQVDKVENMLSILSDFEYNLIKLRDINKLKYKDIATILKYSEEHLIKLRNGIIREKLVPIVKIYF